MRNDNRAVVDSRMAGGEIVELDPPAGLSPGAVAVFEQMTPALLRAKVLREDDIPMLEQCCEAWAMARYYRTRTWTLIDRLERAQDELDGLDGDEFREKLSELEVLDGSMKRARAGWNQSSTLAARLSSELGLGPVARVKLGLARVQGQSLLEALMGDNAGQS